MITFGESRYLLSQIASMTEFQNLVEVRLIWSPFHSTLCSKKYFSLFLFLASAQAGPVFSFRFLNRSLSVVLFPYGSLQKLAERRVHFGVFSHEVVLPPRCPSIRQVVSEI